MCIIGNDWKDDDNLEKDASTAAAAHVSSQMQHCTCSDQSIFSYLIFSPSTFLHSYHFRQSIVIHANGCNTSLFGYLLSFSWDLFLTLVQAHTPLYSNIHAPICLFFDIRFMYKSETGIKYIGIIHSYGLYRHISYDEKFIFLFI